MDTRIVMVTSPNLQEARQMAREIVESRLAACVNIVPGITSVYEWEDKIEEDAEVLLIIKSGKEVLEALEEKVLNLHSYDTPEFVTLATDHVNPRYQKWLEGVISKG